MNIKSARIVGVLQDWDLYDYRYDVERVNVDVPLRELEGFTNEEIESMVEDGCFNCSYEYEEPLESLIAKGVKHGWFTWHSHWEWEDPCELKLEIEEG